MLKRFSHIAIYLLLVLMPLQSMAAANMLICNSIMHMDKINEKIQMMPCHEQMSSLTSNSTNQSHDSDTSNSKKYKNVCKSNCTHCASMCAMAALPSHLKSAILEASAQTFSSTYQPYVSITLPNPQRPPIRLS
jgi:mannitol-specific phosphotransferase system IIBC component